MGEARHGVMMLGEEFGIKLPRAVSGFIASIGPVGAAMEAAFPFLAIVAGATILIEHFSKLHEESEKLALSQLAFGTTIRTTFGNLDDKLLAAEIRVDELNKDHLGALAKTLELIDHKSLSNLAQEFNVIATAADKAISEISEKWYNIGTVEKSGASNALKTFRAEYESLLAQGKQEEAHGLLTGTLKQAKEFRDNMAAQQEGHGSSPEELTRQDALVTALTAQLNIEKQIARLKDDEAAAATKDTQNKIAEDAKKASEERKRIEEQSAKDFIHLLSTQSEAEALYTKSLKKEADQQNIALRQAADATIKNLQKEQAQKKKMWQQEIEWQKEAQQEAGERLIEAKKQQTAGIMAAEQRMREEFAQTAASAILESQSISQAFGRLGQQMLQQALTNLLQMETVQGRKKFSDARTAAADAFAWAGNPILGAILAPVAFASVMAFERGGEIPGIGGVPIVAHGGETVVTKALTDQVKNNRGGGGHHVHVHTTLNVVDAENFERLLDKHANVVQRHVGKQLRRMNIG